MIKFPLMKSTKAWIEFHINQKHEIEILQILKQFDFQGIQRSILRKDLPGSDLLAPHGFGGNAIFRQETAAHGQIGSYLRS